MFKLSAAAAAILLVSAGETAAKQGGRCADYAFPVYFQPRSSILAPGAANAIMAVAKHVRRCRIAAITVVGVSASAGGRDVMEARLHAVAAELAQRGLGRPAPAIAGAVLARRRPVMADQAEVEIVMAR
jgi:outer membrane protein OmpA-like peptidoglycan-associated protein